MIHLATLSQTVSAAQRWLLAALLAWVFLHGAASAQSGAPFAPAASSAPRNATVSVTASHSAVAPGQAFTLVVRQSLRPGWHVYWRNPGDSGAESAVTWTAPPGMQIGPMQFAPPKTLRIGPLMTYGYEGEVAYPVAARAPTNARPGQTLTLKAEVATFVCEEVCVREDDTITVTLPVAAAGVLDPVEGPRAQAALDAIPKLDETVSARVTMDGARVRLTIAGAGVAGVTPRAAHFFPFKGGVIDQAADQAAQAGADGLSFTLHPLKADAGLNASEYAGLVRIDPVDGAMRAVEIAPQAGALLPGVDGVWRQTPSSAHPAPLGAGQAGDLSLWQAALYAILGGLILNLMPCVFPVLSMKALGLARTAHTGQARRHGLLFFGGVMSTFVVLAGALLALRAAGQQIGWGFQLQEPLAAAALALVFFVIGLNLLGLFEFGGGVQNLGAGLAARDGDVGAFFTGALAVVAASPCTAPFMAGAIGFTSTAPPAEAMIVFAGLGFGFALPFTALAFAPRLLQRLPKPGPWMDRFKQAMAFPMFGAAVWMAWVVAVGAGADGALAVLIALLAVAFLIWALRAFAGAIPRAIAAGFAAIALAVAIGLLQAPAPAAASSSPQAWSAAKVESLRAEGKAVFVNFTAAWCVTCKVNELTTLNTNAVKTAFAQKDVTYLKGDWTRPDPAITAELARYGRNGVPLYLFFPAGGEGPAQVLPEVLTEAIVLNALRAR